MGPASATALKRGSGLADPGHGHPQDGLEEILHRRIRLHTLPAQNIAPQES